MNITDLARNIAGIKNIDSQNMNAIITSFLIKNLKQRFPDEQTYDQITLKQVLDTLQKKD